MRLAKTLNVVQSKLAFLESENSISRRRVRELELELEACKQQVARERTKVLEREQVDTDANERRSRPAKSGLRNVGVEAKEEDADADISRYKEAVEEKKGLHILPVLCAVTDYSPLTITFTSAALESLISTLRSHLSRLTAELSDHHRLLQELRTLRDLDVRALKEKSRDVDQLRQEVERLGGEVEVLRGVVEEGLKERREVRELEREQAQEQEREVQRSRGSPELFREQQTVEAEGEGEAENLQEEPQPMHLESENESASGRSSPSPRPSPVRARTADKTIRTDEATFGSPRFIATATAGTTTSQPFVTAQEIERIAEEVSERRSERSATSDGSNSRASLREPSSSLHSFSGSSLSRADEGSEDESATELGQDGRAGGRGAGSPLRDQQQQHPVGRAAGRRPPSRGAAERIVRPSSRDGSAASIETPFPQIRGEYLERLFFSAPEHNADTCTVCHRRRKAKSGRATTTTAYYRRSSWGPEQRQHQEVTDDEGFAEGEEDARPTDARRFAKGKERERTNGYHEQTPPQTVVARVLRELEDDFTHYKRYTLDCDSFHG